MGIQMPSPQGQTEWKKIDLGEHGDFEIEIRRPTWQELTDDAERTQGYLAARLERHVVGWRGVTDSEGNPAPYSWAAFQAFCAGVPAVFQLASGVVSRLYIGLPETEEKNSDAPSTGC